MKSNIWKYAAALFMGVAMIASCDDPAKQQQPDPEPVFPTTTVNKTVAAGETVELSLEPNLAWEVSVSGDGAGNYFWLDDAGMKATRIAGKEAGAVTVTVVFSTDEELDVNRVCDVTLTMAGQSKKVATLTRPSLGRTFELRIGVAGEDGFTEDFGTETVTEADLMTFAGLVDYTLPVRVVSNYAWNIALPSWLKATDIDGKAEINSGAAGTTDILLSAVLTAEQINGAEDVVRFIDAANTSVVNELAITLPEFASRLEYEVNSMEFNIQGHLLMASGSYAEAPAVIYVLAANGFTVKALEWNGTYHDIKYADWVNIGFGSDTETGSPIQYRDVTITVNENPAEERYADIFVFPVSMGDVAATDICDENNSECGFKAEYAKYHIGRLIQAGEVPPYITPSSSEELRAEVGTYFSMLEPKADDNILQWDFETAQTYHKITYTCEWSADEASFECSKPYAAVKLFEDVDYPVGFFSKEVTEDPDCWISFAGFGENMKGRFNMNYVPQSPTHTAAVFYDEKGNILSAVLVEYNPASTGGDDNGELPVKITTGDGEVLKMDPESELYMAICGNYNVTDVYQVITNDKMVYVETPVEYWGVVAINPATFGNYSGPLSFEGAAPNFYVYTGKGAERAEVVYILQVVGADGESMVNHTAIHVIYDPNAEIEVEAPISFVYPEYVNGLASLAPYTGDMLSTILGEQWGLSEADVYELKFTDPSASSVAVLNVPSAPKGGSAWNNWPYSADYWLLHEMSGNQMTVYMSEAGKYDYFVFYDSTGLPQCALVCTLQLAQ